MNTHHSWRTSALVLFMLLTTLLRVAPAEAFDICDRSSATIGDLLRAIQNDTALQQLADAPDYLSYADGAAQVIWNFTRPNSAAHPAVICRAVVKDGTAISVRMQVVCGGPKAACDRMVADFQALNDQVRKDMQRGPEP